MPAGEEMDSTAAISVVCHSVAGCQNVWSETVCTFHNCYLLLFLHFEISLISLCLIVDKTTRPFLQFTTHWSSYLRRHITCIFDNVVKWVILICVCLVYMLKLVINRTRNWRLRNVSLSRKNACIQGHCSGSNVILSSLMHLTVQSLSSYLGCVFLRMYAFSNFSSIHQGTL